MANKAISSLGEFIRGERLKQGISQRELAEKTELPQSVLSKLESGQQRNVQESTLKKLAAGLNRDVEVLREIQSSGPELVAAPWEEYEYLLNQKVEFVLTHFRPSDSEHIWLVLGLLLSDGWSIRQAAVTCLARAAARAIEVEAIHKALNFVAKHDLSRQVRDSATEALNLLKEPRENYMALLG